MFTQVLVLLGLVCLSLAASEMCYAGKLDLNLDIPTCYGNETSSLYTKVPMFCKNGVNFSCTTNTPPVCKYVYFNSSRPVAQSGSPTGSPSPTASSSMTRTTSGVPSASPTGTRVSASASASPAPSCSMLSRNLTQTYCRPVCIRGDLPCSPLLRDAQGLVRNLTVDQMVRFGDINGKYSPFNSTLDLEPCSYQPTSSCDTYRPRYSCELRGNFYRKTDCVSGIGTVYNTRPFLECSLCYPCFETDTEARIASGSSTSLQMIVAGVTTYCPQPDGVDPVGCFLGDEIDSICLSNFNKGVTVNGDVPFCDTFGCNPHSTCNCSFVDFHEECYDGEGSKLSKLMVEVLITSPTANSSVYLSSKDVRPQISFDGRFLKVVSQKSFEFQLRAAKPILKISGRGNEIFDLRGKLPPGEVKVFDLFGNDTFTFNVEKDKHNNHRTLGIIMFSLSLTVSLALVFYGCYKCLPKTWVSFKTIPAYKSLSSQTSKTFDYFLPKTNFMNEKLALGLFIGIGLVSSTLIKTDGQILITNLTADAVLVNDCSSIYRKEMNEVALLPYHNKDCTFQVDYYLKESLILSEEIFISSWKVCEVRSDWVGNLMDSFDCSSSLTTVLLAAIIILCCLTGFIICPSVVKLSLLVLALTVPVRSCDFSQTLTSSSVSCVNTQIGQNCSFIGTMSAEMKMEEVLCMSLRSPYGSSADDVKVTYSSSFEKISLRVVGYTQAFEQSHFSKNRCNDCTFSCNGDCSSDQCQLIGGFGVNPNNQNNDLSTATCPSFSGCDLVQDSLGSSWTSGCLLKPNCHWWQYISCGAGEVSPIKSVFRGAVVSTLTVSAGDHVETFRTDQAQPFKFKDMLISTSTQSNPLDLQSLDFDSMVLKNGSAYVCRTQGFDESRRSELGDYFCVESTCTYTGPSSIRIPDNMCEHTAVGSDSVFSCYRSFYSDLETQITCKQLPYLTDFGLLDFDGNQLNLMLRDSSTLEVRISANNATFAFSNDIIKPSLSIESCSAYVDYAGSGTCTLKGSCSGSGLVSVSTDSSYIDLLSTTILCSENSTILFTTSKEENDFDFIIGNFIFNETLKVKFTAENYTAQVQEQNVQKDVEDSGWEPFSSWGNLLNGIGDIWDWLIVIVECILLLAALCLVLYVLFQLAMCCVPSALRQLKRFKVRSQQQKKDEESLVDLREPPRSVGNPPKKAPMRF